MVKKTKGKHRLDKFYHLAKEQGYRSRAAFKLIQLNRKYDFLSSCRAVLDLCAAPGGWLQVCVNVMPVASTILGVDLAPIKPIRGAKTFVADITTQKCRQMIKKEAAGSSFNVVLHDGAPNVGGAWSTEAYTQSALVLDALKLATEMLSPGGTFVTKIFRSKDYNALLYAFQQLFNKVEATKPAASRNASAEIFVVCLGYKAPSKIDPRLLDTKHLFQEVVEAPKNMGPEALIRQQIKQKRHREGYEEGVSLIHRPCSALAFIASKSHVELMGRATSLVLEGTQAADVAGQDDLELSEDADAADLAAKIRALPVTTSEIKELCRDLQVLGRSEFKQLIKWRLQVRKALKSELEGKKGAKGEGGEEEGEGKDEPVDPEEKLLQEMQDLKEKLSQRAKKEKKKRREVKKKSRVRAAQMAQSEGIELDTAPDNEAMFRLQDVAGVSQLKKLTNTPAPGAQVMDLLEQPDSDDMVSEDDDSDLDSEDEALRYEQQLEESMERSYQEFLKRKGVKKDLERAARARLGKGGDLESESEEEKFSEDEEEEKQQQQPAKKRKEGVKGGGLLVELDSERAGVAKTPAAMAAQWFKQDIFKDPNLVADADEQDTDKNNNKHSKKRKESQQPKVAPSSDDDDDGGELNLDSDGGQTGGRIGGKGGVLEQANGALDSEEEEERPVKRRAEEVSVGNKERRKADDLEIVPQDSDIDPDSDSDSEHEFDLLDAQGKAEVLALAKRMMRRKGKETIIDAAFNRYAFHDDNLPRWFRDDEHRHMKPIPMVTKEEVEAEKAELRAIDARPMKKVAQAKARKQRKLRSRLDQASKKATGIANQDDVPMRSKMKEIEKLYAKARASVNGKGGKKGQKGGKGKPLDKRMRADQRGTKKIEARLKKAGKSIGKGGSKGGQSMKRKGKR